MARLELRDYFTELSKGNISNSRPLIIVGHNLDVDAAAQEDVWEQGGELTYLTAAETMNIVSSSIADAAAGTGARTVRVEGLNASYEEISETVTMNGTTNVLTANAYLRVHKLEALTAGTGTVNAGNITATASTAATVQCRMTLGDSISHHGFYTVPLNHRVVIFNAELNAVKIAGGALPVVDFRIYAREIGTHGATAAWLRLWDKSIDVAVSNSALLEQTISEFLPEKTDIRIAAKTDTNNTEVKFRAYLGLFVNGY